MCAYCHNNPIIFADTHGTDACVVIDDQQALWCGHIGFFVQDDEGEWWHFYWGPQNGIIPVIGIDVEDASWFVEYEGEISLDAINSSGQYWKTYDRMIYLEGDFSDCIDYANNLDADYNLYNNNCSQVSLDILSKADTPYKDRLQCASTFYVIPKCAFSYLMDTCKTTTRRGGGSKNMFSVIY